eukprot:scaffold91330_cov31-Prasinocladus_malaysianus.AAC.1
MVGGLGFWELAQTAVEQGLQTGIFTKEMLELFLGCIKGTYAEGGGPVEGGIYSVGASCWMTLWWLSTLHGIVTRGEANFLGPSVFNANKLLQKASQWRGGAKLKAAQQSIGPASSVSAGKNAAKTSATNVKTGRNRLEILATDPYSCWKSK